MVKAMRGGASGGTIDSARTAVDTVKKDPPIRRVLADPYALSPDREAEPDLGSERDSLKPFRDDRLGGWMAPFVMGSVNTRVVRRSNALRDHAYGSRFRYRELMATGTGPLGLAKATGVAGGSPACSRASRRRVPASCSTAFSRTRRGARRADQGARLLQHRHPRTTSSGKRLRCEIRVQGDPGYKATAVMLGESALCLALDDLPDVRGRAHARLGHGPRSRRPPDRGGARLPRRGGVIGRDAAPAWRR